MYCITKVTDFTFVVQKDNHVVEFVRFFFSFLILVKALAR